MKKTLTIIMLMILTFALFAEVQKPGRMQKTFDQDGSLPGKITGTMTNMSRSDRSLSWESNYTLQNLLNPNYYDYMPGGYSNTPIRLQPGGDFGDGLFLTYMGKPTGTGHRRVYYAYVGSDGVVEHNDLFTSVDAREGYSSMDIDKWGKMMMAWHVDPDGDEVYDIKMGWDPYFAGIPGIPSDAYNAIVNEITMNGFDDNEFIWPSTQVGPSPLGDDYQRVYILGRNSTSHSVLSEETGNPSPVENPYIAYADYQADDVDFGLELTWSYLSIPTIDAWNVDTNEWRRPFFSFIVGEGVNAGKVIYMGYHVGDIADDEMNYDVFVHEDYCNPTSDWIHNSFDLSYPVDNPANADGSLYFVDQNNGNAPLTNMDYTITSNGHFTLGWDLDGNLHMPSTFALTGDAADGKNYYYPSLHILKDVVYNVAENELYLEDVFPKTSDNEHFVHWDLDNDGNVDQYWDDGTYDNIDDDVAPDEEGYGNIKMDSIFPFPHYDEDSHDEAMIFHLAHTKITNANEDGVMAMVWHDSTPAKDFHKSNLTYWEPYQNTNEIYISLSTDNGATWQTPIAFSGVSVADDFWQDESGEDLGFGVEHAYIADWSDMIPMFAYPAEELIHIGSGGNGSETYRLFFYFHDDDAWGCSTQEEGQPGPGKLVFTALDFTVNPTSNEGATATLSNSMLKGNYPNPFNPTTKIAYTSAFTGNVNISVYNIKGQLVKTLVNEHQVAGNHDVVWNGDDNNGKQTTSGVYFYKITNGNRTETKKMLMVK